MAINDWLGNNSGALLAASAGLLGGRTGNEQAALGMAGFGNAMAESKQKNKTLDFLRKMNPELAQAVEAGTLSPLDAYKTHIEAQQPKKPNFVNAGGSLYNPDTGEWISPPAGAGNDAEFGLNPQYGVDAQGNPVILQLSKGGTSKQTALPDGVSLSKEPIKLDAGTHFVLLDPITRQPVGQIPKDLAGAEREKTGGKLQGEAAAALPQVETAANQMLATIDSLASDPYLPNMLGPWDSRTPNLTTDAARVQSKMDQIGGQSFLQAFNMLKGAGQITEIEGQKATQAMARLNTAQNDADYKAALNELRSVVNSAITNARIKAGQGGAPAQGQRLRFNPATGELE